jgi:ribokinase
MGNVVVIGSFMTDLMSRAPHLPKPGETVMGGPFKLGPGGKGANQAVACSRLGGDVWFVGSIGNDYFGDVAKESFESNKVHIDYLERISDTHTGAALIGVSDENGENLIIIAPGTNSYISKNQVNLALENIKDIDIVLVQYEIPEEILLYVAKLLNNKDIMFIVNPAPGRKSDMQFLKKIDFIIPNETELEILTDSPIKSIEDAEKNSKKLLSKGVKNVITTLGANGALFVTSGKVKHFKAFHVNAVDTTGAGDAFCGAFAYALSKGKSIDESIIIANAVSAISVTKIGTAPAMPYKKELDDFLQDNNLGKI